MTSKTRALKILIFAPHSAIWVHAFPESLIGESLQKSGHKIVYVACGGLFKTYCVPIRNAGLNQESSIEDKEKVCLQCDTNKDLIRRKLKINGYDLSSLTTQADLLRAEKISQTATKENFKNLVVDEIDVGKIALYEFLIQHKKLDYNFTDQEWSRYLIALRNVLLSLFVSVKILDREKPERIIMYNTLYSVNLTMCRLAEKRGIPYFVLHGNSNLAHRLEGLYIGRGHTQDIVDEMKRRWPEFKDHPIAKEEISFITDHMLALFKGSNIYAYSAPIQGEDLRRRFAIGENQKILVAAMSCYDETFAYESLLAKPPQFSIPFKDQIEWIRALIEFAKTRKDLFLVIRVHPREFPNKRETTKSWYVEKLAEELTDLPENVRVNWPSDGISIYDVAEDADVFLVSWSSVGKEMPLLGLPVVAYHLDYLTYHPDLNYCGITRKEYFDQIEIALTRRWDFERIRKAYRWYAHDQIRPVIDISQSFKVKEFTEKSKFERGLNKALRMIYPTYLQRWNILKRGKKLKTQEELNKLLTSNLMSLYDVRKDTMPTTSPDDETRFIREEMRRLILGMYGKNTSKPRPGTLREWLLTELQQD